MLYATPTDSPKHRLAPGGWPAGAWFAGVAAGLLTLLSTAQAQMVPRAEHALRQNTNSYTSVRIDLNAAEGDEVRGRGLALRGQGFWPHWEGRIGVVVDRPINPLKDSFVLAQPNQATCLRVRSVHVLSDYYLDGGFRATAGLVGGEPGQAWWSSGGTGGGLNLSLQRIDSLGLMSSAARSGNPGDLRTSPYLGAGYSRNLNADGTPSAWRFNADLGVISVNANNMNRIGQMIQGDKSLDELVRELRLRPVIKVSVGYSF